MILVHVQKMYKTCYSSSFLFFSKNEEEAIPPGGKTYLGTTKGSTRMIFVHGTEDVQNMYRRCTILFRILIGVPDYSSIFLLFFFK